MNFERVMQLIGRLGGTLKFFPSDPDARIGIAEEIAEMADSEEQVRWLIGRLPKIHREWPGMHEVRAAFCGKYKPKDGIEAYSAVYPDGIPSEKPDLPALSAAPAKQLAAGEATSAAASIADTVRGLVVSKDMNRVLRGVPAPAVPDIPVVKLTDANRITAADIARAVKVSRDRQAVEDCGIDKERAA